MTQKFVRHLISFLSMLVALIAWMSGYFSAAREWWWTVFGVIFIYAAIYQILEM